MKKIKAILRDRLCQVLPLLNRSCKMIAAGTRNPKRFLLPLFLMLFLFSCRKEEEFMIPETEQNTEQNFSQDGDQPNSASCGTTDYQSTIG
jgi:hypothetical protein